MARRSRFGGRVEVVSLALQDLHVRKRFTGFQCTFEKGTAVWRGKLSPTENSGAYLVEVGYKILDVPKVRVISPKLAEGAPHLYPGGVLCLYWPREWTWRRDQLVAETIIPWAALWLFYYELWLDTGEWLGPSSHSSWAKEIDAGKEAVPVPLQP